MMIKLDIKKLLGFRIAGATPAAGKIGIKAGSKVPEVPSTK